MSFNLNEIKSNNFETLPDGKYTCTISDAMLKDTKSGTGEYVKVTFTIRTGEQEGRKIFTQFNVKNDNPKAVEIGLQQIKSLLENSDYSGDFKFANASDIPVAIAGLTVGVKTKTSKSEQYGDKSEPSYYFKPEASKDEPLPF